MSDEKTLDEARNRMTALAMKLAAKFGALDAGGTLIGSGVALLVQANGDEWAADYLRELAAELETDPNLYQGNA